MYGYGSSVGERGVLSSLHCGSDHVPELNDTRWVQADARPLACRYCFHVILQPPCNYVAHLGFTQVPLFVSHDAPGALSARFANNVRFSMLWGGMFRHYIALVVIEYIS